MYVRIAKRFGREILGIIVTGLCYYYSGHPAAIILKPLLSALGKYLREQGMSNIPI